MNEATKISIRLKATKLLLGLSLLFSLVGCNQNMDSSPVTPDASPLATPWEAQSTPPYNKSDIPSIDESAVKAYENDPVSAKIDNEGFVTANVSLSGDELTVVYSNNTEKIFGFPPWIDLQFYNGNAFVDVPSDMAYNLMPIPLPAHESYKEIVNLKETFGVLQKGRYRIVKEMNGGPRTYYFYVMAEFDF